MTGLTDASVTFLAAGTQLGPYKLLSEVGSGGMGTVFLAEDTRLGRKVAVKVSRTRYTERFQREAEAIAKLSHPNICTLFDVGPDYMVMELLDGETLAARLRREKLPIDDVLRSGARIAEALAAAHEHGIVHRDLKPANIMLSRHGVKVLDFGLAKVSDSGDHITESHFVMGTPAYMAPEQVMGEVAGPAADLFALGLVLYEMTAGKLPFPGVSLGRMFAGGSQSTPPSLSRERAGLPAGLDPLIAGLLERDPSRRSPSAAETARRLEAMANRIAAPPLRPAWARPVFMIPAAAVLLLAGVWFWQRSEHRRWAREDAIPEVNRLVAADKPLAAFLVLRKAESYLPGDSKLLQIERSSTTRVSVKSTPPGANVEIQDYLSPDGAWVPLGTTPLQGVGVPKGYYRWRVSKPAVGDFIAARPALDSLDFRFGASTGSRPGMVPVPGGKWLDLIDFLGWVYYDLPDFDIDRFEVTNRQFQEFVDQGGYRKRDHWKEKFIRDGKELSWEQAMDLFRDPTGRPGPSTWEGGHFPQGQDDYPVSGVSWYEAAAYADFAGKSLPALGQWYKAADPEAARFIVNESNFGGKGPARVGSFAGVGPYGTYDTAGNVREWILNAVDSDRFILGGAWRTQTYQAFDPEALPPFDRSPMNGFRTVFNKAKLADSITAPIVRHSRDFSRAKAVSDEMFQAYRTMYAYDNTPLNAEIDDKTETTPDWTKQRITIDAGYGKERLPIYLFLPKNVHPPYQAVVFFPSARVNLMPDSRNLGDMPFVDYVIRSGRALAYPIYRETYERGKDIRIAPGAIEDLQLVIQESKEVRRTVDYLQTRPEIDKNKLAYLGVSQGSAYGVIFTALDDRFKAIVFLDGGFFLGPTLPERDQVNFAARINKPVLMVNGQYDFTFSPDRSQLPLLKAIATPEADKRRVVSETSHDVSQDRPLLSREVLGWLDRYLGKVD